MGLSETVLYPVIVPIPTADRECRGREKVRNLSRQARLALWLSCKKSGLPLGHLPKDATGVPLPVNGVYWSLSHKSEIAGGVAASLPVGLDLETLRPVKDGLLTKVADASEWRLADTRDERTFFRFWTAKEAVLKAVGKGMTGMSRCRIFAIEDDTRMILTFDGIPWPVEHHFWDRHVAAATSHHLEILWTITP